ncbi:MAG: hypothetical protein SFU85_09900 [Candidatus Methylacidiphilales bacterium]|nr:hypothetical protein [Candidatus Methylacidiphilales bacterium]
MMAVAALTVALTGFAALPAAAQTADASAVLAACSGPNVDVNSCNAAVALYVQAAKALPPNQADALLANLVVVLASSTAGVSNPVIAQAIQNVAVQFNDTSRANTAVLIAQAVEVGDPLDEQVVQTLASPT